MSCLASANLETRALTTQQQDELQRPKPVLVRTWREYSADWVARRVAEVVDRELANGSMPA